MLRLNEDTSFHFEILRTLGHARYGGSDVADVLEAAGSITAGNLESFTAAFLALAKRTMDRAEAIDAKKYPVSAREAFFQASTYFRAADFYLHGNAEDPRINDFWDKQLLAFDKAISLLPIPAERITLKSADGTFEIPTILFRATGKGDPRPRPTVILGNGFDGAQEEMLHVNGFAALDRGYNVITYEGPGQPTVRRKQGLGFMHEWEKVVSPVVDFLLSPAMASFVDPRRIGLLGYSMGGWFAVRAAAYEPRLAAVIAVDGAYDIFDAFNDLSTPQLRALYDAGEFDKVNEIMKSLLASEKTPTILRWGIQHGVWSFHANSVTDFMERTRSFTFKGMDLRNMVKCPAWIGCASDDIFLLGQPEKARDALAPERTTYRELTAKEGAGTHCHVGAMVMANAIIFEWFDKVTL